MSMRLVRRADPGRSQLDGGLVRCRGLGGDSHHSLAPFSGQVDEDRLVVGSVTDSHDRDPPLPATRPLSGASAHGPSRCHSPPSIGGFRVTPKKKKKNRPLALV